MATADDDVLLPPGDPQIAVLVEITQIAGPKVGLAAVLDIEIFVPRLIRVSAALDHTRPVDAGFTDLSGLATLLDLTVVTAFQHEHARIGHRQPHRPHFARADDRVRRHDAGCLGHAVAFEDR